MSINQLRWRGASYAVVLLLVAGYIAIKMGMDQNLVGRICTLALPAIGLAGAYWGPAILQRLLDKDDDAP